MRNVVILGLCAIVVLAAFVVPAGAAAGSESEISPPSPGGTSQASSVSVTWSVRPSLCVRCDGWSLDSPGGTGGPERLSADFTLLSNVGPFRKSIRLEQPLGEGSDAATSALADLRSTALSRAMEYVRQSSGGTVPAELRVTQE